MNYERSQIGWIMIVLFTIIPMQISYSYFKQGPSQLPTLVYILLMILMIGALLSFYRLKINADQSSIRLSFGIGLIRLTIKPAIIKNTEIVAVPWHYGLGIRTTPMGMLYNVHGSKAVRITYQEVNHHHLAKDKTVTIGTDDPQGLYNFLQSHYQNPNN